MEKVLNKKALASALAEKTGLTIKDSIESLNVIIDTITEALKAGNTVELYGFGKFEVKERSARTGLNPKTKETVKIPATKVASFKASKALKDAVKGK